MPSRNRILSEKTPFVAFGWLLPEAESFSSLFVNQLDLSQFLALSETKIFKFLPTQI
jgi:hypothetical protein